MQAIAVFLNAQPAWHWLALGAVLLALEIASTTQYLLWPGIAALFVGGLKALDPALDGRLAVFLFAVIAVVATVVWKRSSWGRADRTTHSNLNQRSAQYVGRVVKAEDDFVNGRGAVRVDDTRWNASVVDGSAPAKGDMLQISGADGTELKVQLAPGSLMLGAAAT
ncbi:MAG TPA: NfeD family protein [Rhizomicrobium sp.]|jgi:membrane protein implicated in regulation of membrane protease activity|nr:NfeD family protein [Rhizomicrobium sp.]